MPDTTAMRDELAELKGYDQCPCGCGSWGICQQCTNMGVQHPFPDGDLNALFAAIPKGANYSLSRTAEGICELRSGWPVPYEGNQVMGEYAAVGEWLLAVLKAVEVGDE